MTQSLEQSSTLEMARLLDGYELRLRALETARTSYVASVRSYDPVTGDPTMNVGINADGTYGPTYFNTVAPPVPAAPTVNPTYGGITVAHFGGTSDGTPWPMDFSHLEIHMSSLEAFQPTDGTQVGTFNNERGGLYAAMDLDPDVTYWVRLIAVNTSGTESLPTAAVSCTPSSAVSQEDLQAFDRAIASALDDLSDAENLTRGIFYNDVTAGEPAPVDPAVNDVWFKPDAGYAIYRFDGTDWVDAPAGFGALAAFPITAPKIAAGAVVADKIAAGAVTTEHLTVGSVGDNLILNGNFADLIGAAGTAPFGWGAAAVTAALSSVAVGDSTFLKAITPAAPTQSIYQTAPTGLIPARAGDGFHVEVGAGAVGGSANLQLVMHQYANDGTFLATVTSPVLAANNYSTTLPGRNRVSAVLKVDEGSTTVAGVRFGVAPTTASKTYYFDKYTVGKVSVSARIGDGAITAPKILAGAVITEKLAARAVNADKIEVGSITADLIHLSTKGFAVNANSNMELEAVDANGVGLGRPAYYTMSVGWPGFGGTLSYETVAPLSGSKSARITVPANTDARLYWDYNPEGGDGTIAVQPGDKWFVSARVKAVGGDNVAGSAAYIIFHVAPPGAWPFDLTGGYGPADWHYAGSREIANGAEVTVAGSVTISTTRNDRRGRISLTLPRRTAACTYIVDDFVCHPAVDDAQVTEISAGKLVTGFIRAGQRIIAGTSEDGARTEMAENGFFAFNTTGARTFTVQGWDGQTIIGNPGGINMALSAYGNVWNSGNSQAMLKFSYPGSGWSDGALFAQYASDYGAIRIQSPHVGDVFANTAYLDLRGRNDGHSYAYLRAAEVQFSANTYLLGSGSANNTADFRLAPGTPGFTFSDYSATSRLNLYADFGQFRLRGQSDTGAAQRLCLQGADVALSFGGQELYAHMKGSQVGFHSYNKNIGLQFGVGRLVVSTYMIDLHQPIEASAFQVVSDPRLKKNAVKVDAKALDAVRAMAVYDYDMKGILPRKEEPPIHGPWREHEVGPPIKANRARGVMADELRQILPDAVHETAGGELSLNLYDLVATTIAALQALDVEVANLKNKHTTQVATQVATKEPR